MGKILYIFLLTYFLISTQEFDGFSIIKTKEKSGNLILDTSENIFSKKELKKIRFLEVWAILGPIVGIIIGLLF